MGSRVLSRRPGELRHLLLARRNTVVTTIRFDSTSHLPRVAQPSLWQSLVPKFLRSDNSAKQPNISKTENREWNPATPLILLGILVGSQAIHLMNIKSEMLKFSRKTDTRIASLREVIRRVQAGEEVDVEKILGTGDPASEQEWKEVMKEIEGNDHLWAEKKWKVKRREQAQAEQEAARTAEGSSPKWDSRDKSSVSTSSQKSGARFY